MIVQLPKLLRDNIQLPDIELAVRYLCYTPEEFNAYCKENKIPFRQALLKIAPPTNKGMVDIDVNLSNSLVEEIADYISKFNLTIDKTIIIAIAKVVLEKHYYVQYRSKLDSKYSEIIKEKLLSDIDGDSLFDT